VDSGEKIISIPMVNKNSLELSIQSKEKEASYLQFNVALNSSGSIPESEIVSKKSDYNYSQGA
jgi:hypothetical protein